MTENRQVGPSLPFRIFSWALVVAFAPFIGFGLMVTGLFWLARKVTRRKERPADWWHPRMEDPGGP
jgi:hypothetical protein